MFMLIIGLNTNLFSQDSTGSLAFKYNRPTDRVRFYPSYNFSYQLWQRFILTKDANAGDPVAQHELGIRYLLGDGFECDTIEAVKWIEKSADKKFTPAIYNYAIMLLNGIGGNWDPFKAFLLMKEAALNGMREAQYAYGLFFTDNLAVKKEMNSAFHWLKKSSEKGFQPATEVINEFIEMGINPSEISNTPQTDRDFSKSDTTITNNQPIIMPTNSLVYLDLSQVQDSVRQIENDDVLLQYLKHNKLNLDTTKVDSKFDEFNFEKYIDSIEIGSENGSPESITLIGLLYQTGTYYKRDLIRAAKYYIMAIRLENPFAPSLLWRLTRTYNLVNELKEAVNQKNFDANYVWAGIHTLGFQSYITDKDALNLLTSASNNLHIPSMIELGYSYINGNLSKFDREAGIIQWEKASSLKSIEAKTRILFLDALQLTNFNDITTSIDFLITTEAKGSVLAQIVLGYYYEMGYGFIIDEGRAAHFYRKAASRGSKIGINALTRLYNKKRPTDKLFLLN
jgi:TPR repeat protein